MRDLYDQLRDSNQKERYAVAERLVAEMREPTTKSHANADYYRFCERILRSLGIPESGPPHHLQKGIFTAYDSAGFINRVPKISGFLQAIHRAANVRWAIDAGCGASAVLAVGIAVSHPNAIVHAYEINEDAFLCALSVAKLLGLAHRVIVHYADVLDTELPSNVDLAVTETFSSGLLNEFGHRITPVLAKHAQEILPRYAVIYASDRYTGRSEADWHEAAVVDLGRRNDTVTGHIESTGRGNRILGAYAGFYDTKGDTIIDTPGTDYLTLPIYLGELKVPKKHTDISFSYPLGTPFNRFNPSLRTE